MKQNVCDVIISRITVKAGFTLSEVRLHRKRIRQIRDYGTKKGLIPIERMKNAISLFDLFGWSTTDWGTAYWYPLHQKLQSIYGHLYAKEIPKITTKKEETLKPLFGNRII